MRYLNRQDAGRRLVDRLAYLKGDDIVVLALPRGGVVLGKEVAEALRAPLGLVLVRKIGYPNDAEYAIGALAEDEEPIYNKDEVTSINPAWLEKAADAAHELIEKRRQMYYGDDFTPPAIKGKIVILVDDGVATGLTMQAAIRATKQKQPKRIIVALPVAPPDSLLMLEELADEVILLDDPDNFLGAVSAHYQDFPQINDEEVKEFLREVPYGLQKTASTHS